MSEVNKNLTPRLSAPLSKLLQPGSLIISLILLLILFPLVSFAGERIKDIASIYGVRSNPLVGYGLVVGLDGTGDNTAFGKRSLRRMLSQFGINTTLAEIGSTKNIAVVALHTDLPAFSKPGQRIDVTVSAMGSAKSLRGGSLLLTPLKAADGKVYAVAQGNLVVGGLGIKAEDGSQVSVNIPVVGRIPNGATIERMAPTPFLTSEVITFNLHRPDFTTAMRLAKSINNFLGSDFAMALDGASVQVQSPADANQRVSFLSAIENLEITTAIAAARIVVNSRTGTIVIGQKVNIKPAAVTHGNLTVSVVENTKVSQPGPFSEGQTVAVNQSEITVEEETKKTFVFKEGASLEELVNAINQVGASPGDLMSVLEALKEAGALEASLVVI